MKKFRNKFKLPDVFWGDDACNSIYHQDAATTKPSTPSSSAAAAGRPTSRVTMRTVRQFMRIGKRHKSHTSGGDSSTEDEGRYNIFNDSMKIALNVLLVLLFRTNAPHHRSLIDDAETNELVAAAATQAQATNEQLIDTDDGGGSGASSDIEEGANAESYNKRFVVNFHLYLFKIHDLSLSEYDLYQMHINT